MINNLKACSPAMYHLFILLRDRRASGVDTTDEDIEVASGKRVLDPRQTRAYLKNLESASDDIGRAFKKQAEVAAVRLSIYRYPLTDLSAGSMGSRQVRATGSGMDSCL